MFLRDSKHQRGLTKGCSQFLYGVLYIVSGFRSTARINNKGTGKIIYMPVTDKFIEDRLGKQLPVRLVVGVLCVLHSGCPLLDLIGKCTVNCRHELDGGMGGIG